jgi:hypothetical protein
MVEIKLEDDIHLFLDKYKDPKTRIIKEEFVSYDVYKKYRL